MNKPVDYGEVGKYLNETRGYPAVEMKTEYHSTWLDKEKEMQRDVLCPVALDDSWKDSRWPKRVMEQIMEYNILDFSAWEDDVKFERMFRKLIDGLQLFYKG